MSGQLESSVFTPNSNFVKLDSLLGRSSTEAPNKSHCFTAANKKDSSELPKDAKKTQSCNKLDDDDDSQGEEERQTNDEGGAFKVTSEQVTQQRMISVEREECHKKEHAVISLEKDSDVQQQRAVTVCRSNTWSCDESSKRLKHSFRFRRVGLQPGIQEDSKDAVGKDVAREAEWVKEDNEGGKESDAGEGGKVGEGIEVSKTERNNETNPSSLQRQTSLATPPSTKAGTVPDEAAADVSKGNRHIVKSFSIIDRDFRCPLSLLCRCCVIVISLLCRCCVIVISLLCRCCVVFVSLLCCCCVFFCCCFVVDMSFLCRCCVVLLC